MAPFFCTCWFSPESWAGDWRSLQAVSFDFQIIAGTSPTNRLDLLRIEHITVTNLSRVVDFQTRPNRLYRLEYTPSLASSNAWTVLTNSLSTTGAWLSVTDSNAAPRRFYRLKARLPE